MLQVVKLVRVLFVLLVLLGTLLLLGVLVLLLWCLLLGFVLVRLRDGSVCGQPVVVMRHRSACQAAGQEGAGEQQHSGVSEAFEEGGYQVTYLYQRHTSVERSLRD